MRKIYSLFVGRPILIALRDRQVESIIYIFRSKMELNVYIQQIFLCIVNIVFTFAGMILNTLVITSFLKSSQLRKKLCYFMILVLSCFDFVAVITNHPVIVVHLVVWLTENYALLNKLKIYEYLAGPFVAFSFYALLVMNVERYLGTCYPIYHRTSVTRRRLLTLLAISLIFHIAFIILVIVEVIPPAVAGIIFTVITVPLFMFINYKLYRISKQNRRNNAISPQQGSKINLKNVSSCLLAAACVVLMSIPTGLYVVFIFVGKARSTNAKLCYVWAVTMYAMNSTFNSLIFFWKNKVLRAEGIKILNTVKGRVFGSQENITRTR